MFEFRTIYIYLYYKKDLYLFEYVFVAYFTMLVPFLLPNLHRLRPLRNVQVELKVAFGWEIDMVGWSCL
jgi:hypothetical protein